MAIQHTVADHEAKNEGDAPLFHPSPLRVEGGFVVLSQPRHGNREVGERKSTHSQTSRLNDCKSSDEVIKFDVNLLWGRTGVCFLSIPGGETDSEADSRQTVNAVSEGSRKEPTTAAKLGKDRILAVDVQGDVVRLMQTTTVPGVGEAVAAGGSCNHVRWWTVGGGDKRQHLHLVRRTEQQRKGTTMAEGRE